MNMILETVFYVLGIVTMSLLLILLLFILAMLLRVRSKVIEFREGFPGKVMGALKDRNMEVASALGLTFAHFLMEKMKDTVDTKRKGSK